MDGIIENSEDKNIEMQIVTDCPQDDVEKKEMQTTTANASIRRESDTNIPENIPYKKRKTRRGKSKRKQPYVKNRIQNVIKPEAPYNTNQFLLEDHCDFEKLDENLLLNDTTINRTRNSSFSVDSDGEFYSSPDDEEKYLIEDFDHQYETVHAEHLNNMSKADLIQEYLNLEQKVEILTNILNKRTEGDYDKTKIDLKMQLELLKNENETLKKQNFDLLSKSKTNKRSNNNSSSSSTSDTSSDSDSSSNSSSTKSSCDILHETDLNNSNIDAVNNCKFINLNS